MQQQADTYSRPNARFDDQGRLEIRASAAGGCRRALWYSATSHPVTNPPDSRRKTMMAFGHALEPVVVQAMRDAGWELDAVDPKNPVGVWVEATDYLRFTGHPDSTGRETPFDEEVLVEIKTRDHGLYRRVTVMGNERSQPEAVAQAAVYTMGLYGEWRDVVIATMNRDSCEWSAERIPAHRVEDAYLETAIRLGALEDHYLQHGPDPEQLPPRDFSEDHWQCGYCDFLDLCRPPELRTLSKGAPAQSTGIPPVTHEQAKEALLAYEDAQARVRKAEEQKKPAQETLLRWLVQEGKERDRLEGRSKTRTVTLVSTANQRVDYKKLNELLAPEVREEVVTETHSQHVRVT